MNPNEQVPNPNDSAANMMLVAATEQSWINDQVFLGAWITINSPFQRQNSSPRAIPLSISLKPCRTPFIIFKELFGIEVLNSFHFMRSS